MQRGPGQLDQNHSLSGVQVVVDLAALGHAGDLAAGMTGCCLSLQLTSGCRARHAVTTTSRLQRHMCTAKSMDGSSGSPIGGEVGQGLQSRKNITVSYPVLERAAADGAHTSSHAAAGLLS